ncbi:cation:proton antiporter [Streptomyces sp. NPDC001792]|uniref:cation:proton antiporter n=1 Tax=Streptomyces sp. NPDC001792 TaxID=3154524 RepID=UPI00331CC06E
MIAVGRPLLRRASEASRRKKAQGTESGGSGESRNFLALVLVGLLLSAACTEWLGLHYIFGAFLFGAIMPRGGDGGLRDIALQRIEPLCGLLLLPAYFVLAGLKVDLSQLDAADIGTLAAILVVAVAGKVLGAYLGARLGGYGSRPAYALGVLLNTRGVTELVVLGVGLELGLLDGTLYSLMVVMAVTTTALVGPLLNRMLPTAGKSGTTGVQSAPVAPGGAAREESPVSCRACGSAPSPAAPSHSPPP